MATHSIKKGRLLLPVADASIQFLPGCRTCGSAHPLAMHPPLDVDACPVCSAPVGTPGTPVYVEPVVTDGQLRIGFWLLSIGRWLFSLTRKESRS